MGIYGDTSGSLSQHCNIQQPAGQEVVFIARFIDKNDIFQKKNDDNSNVGTLVALKFHWLLETISTNETMIKFSNICGVCFMTKMSNFWYCYHDCGDALMTSNNTCIVYSSSCV